MTETGDIGVFNPSREIAIEVTLQILIRHRNALNQAREGELGIDSDRELNDNQRKMNKVKGLYKIISAQREMVNISRPIVQYRCFSSWKKSHPTEEDKTKTPFEDEENDYNKLMMLRELLRYAELDIINAEKTESQKDDYLIERVTNQGKKFELTEKYFEMINGLEDTFEKIYLIMLKHKIVSAGIEEDEEKSYKELEKEARERVRDA